jgi:hypothetical protein
MVVWLQQDNRGCQKLTPPWEGSFIVAEVLKLRAYKLSNSQGEIYNNAGTLSSYVTYTLRIPSHYVL